MITTKQINNLIQANEIQAAVILLQSAIKQEGVFSRKIESLLANLLPNADVCLGLIQLSAGWEDATRDIVAPYVLHCASSCINPNDVRKWRGDYVDLFVGILIRNHYHRAHEFFPLTTPFLWRSPLLRYEDVRPYLSQCPCLMGVAKYVLTEVKNGGAGEEATDYLARYALHDSGQFKTIIRDVTSEGFRGERQERLATCLASISRRIVMTTVLRDVIDRFWERKARGILLMTLFDQDPSLLKSEWVDTLLSAAESNPAMVKKIAETYLQCNPSTWTINECLRALLKHGIFFDLTGFWEKEAVDRVGIVCLFAYAPSIIMEAEFPLIIPRTNGEELQAVAWALRAHHTQYARQTLLMLAGYENPLVRGYALDSLRTWRDDAEVKRLLEAASIDSNPWIRDIATSALNGTGPLPPPRSGAELSLR